MVFFFSVPFFFFCFAVFGFFCTDIHFYLLCFFVTLFHV